MVLIVLGTGYRQQRTRAGSPRSCIMIILVIIQCALCADYKQNVQVVLVRYNNCTMHSPTRDRIGTQQITLLATICTTAGTIVFVQSHVSHATPLQTLQHCTGMHSSTNSPMNKKPHTTGIAISSTIVVAILCIPSYRHAYRYSGYSQRRRR